MAPLQSEELGQDFISILMNKRILKDAAILFHDHLMSLRGDSDSWKYLTSRGIQYDTVRRFFIGSTEGLNKFDLWKHLESKGYSYSQILKSGLYTTIGSDNVPAFWSRRIIFPVFDETSTVQNMTSRALPGTCTHAVHKHMPRRKYTLYDSMSCIKAQGGDLFVVEGPFDRLTLEQAGLNSVCFFGTNGFKPEYAKHMRGANIYVIPDADGNAIARRANFKTYFKMNESFQPNVPRIYVLDLPNEGSEKVDPNSLFGGKADTFIREWMQELVEKAVPLYKTPEFKEWIKERRASAERQTKKKLREQDADNLLSLPIQAVFESLGVELWKEGDIFKCRCIDPEHDDKHASMAVYPSTNTWHCFACKNSGDNIGAVSLVKKLNYVDSCTFLKGEMK